MCQGDVWAFSYFIRFIRNIKWRGQEFMYPAKILFCSESIHRTKGLVFFTLYLQII